MVEQHGADLRLSQLPDPTPMARQPARGLLREPGRKAGGFEWRPGRMNLGSGRLLGARALGDTLPHTPFDRSACTRPNPTHCLSF
jgi:hypothetical protein